MVTAQESPKIVIAKKDNSFAACVKSVQEFYNKSAMNSRVALFGFYGLRDTMR